MPPMGQGPGVRRLLRPLEAGPPGIEGGSTTRSLGPPPSELPPSASGPRACGCCCRGKRLDGARCKRGAWSQWHPPTSQRTAQAQGQGRLLHQVAPAPWAPHGQGWSLQGKDRQLKVDFLQAAGKSQWGACPRPARNPSRAKAPRPHFVPGSDGLGGMQAPICPTGALALPRPRAGSPGSSISPKEGKRKGRRGEGSGVEQNGCPATDSQGSALSRDGEDSALYQAPGSLGKAAPSKKAAPESHRLHGALPGRPLGSLCTRAQACLPSQTAPRAPQQPCF